MATITLSYVVPDDMVQEILDTYAIHYGYDPAIHGTKQQFLKQGVREHIKQAWLEQLKKTGRQASDTTAANRVNSVPMT